MASRTKKSLKQLNDVIRNDYGFLLDDSQLLELAEKLSRLTLLAKKHKARRIICRQNDLISFDY